MTDSYLYTLGQIRSNVYRALDEYSSNGREHERFGGGTADMDKRFIAALNCAVRRLYRSSSRTLSEARVLFFSGKVLTCADGFLLEGGEEEIVSLSENAYSSAFEYCGSGKLTVTDSDGNKTDYPLSSAFGRYQTERIFLPDNAERMTFHAGGTLFIRLLRVYSPSGLPEKNEENRKLLPDGKRLYCAFPPLCAELCSVRRGTTEYPSELFTLENGVLSCDVRHAGEYVVSYYAYPEPIAENAPFDTVIPLNPSASDALIYLVAAELCDREDGELYTRLLYKYRELLTNTYPCENIKIKNRYYGGRFFGRGKKHWFRG